MNTFSQDVRTGGTTTPSPTSSPPPTPTATSSPSSTPPPSGTACSVKYMPTSVWDNGFTVDVVITNKGSSTINGWNLTYNLPSGQQVTSAWNATVTQSGSAVSARNVSYNGTLSPGASTSFGYQGTLSGPYSSPTSFSLNGITCSRA